MAPSGPKPLITLEGTVDRLETPSPLQPGNPQSQDPGMHPDLIRRLARHRLLLPLLQQEVIADAVSDVVLSDDERSEAQKSWCARQEISSQENFADHLREHGLRESDAVWQAELPLRISRHCMEHFSHRAEQRFLARKNELDEVVYSLLRVEQEALARELYIRIAEGEADFAELAATYAQGPERSTRGVVGPVPILQAHPILAEQLRTSRPGELRPPLRIERWWLVVRLEVLRPASFDEDMRERMARELFEQWVEEEVERRLAALIQP